jgi:hypothetical protein
MVWECDEEAVNRMYALLDSDQPGEKKEYEWGSVGLKKCPMIDYVISMEANMVFPCSVRQG